MGPWLATEVPMSSENRFQAGLAHTPHRVGRWRLGSPWVYGDLGDGGLSRQVVEVQAHLTPVAVVHTIAARISCAVIDRDDVAVCSYDSAL